MGPSGDPFIMWTTMNPKSGLRPYLERDVEDIVEAIIDDEGNVASQIKIVVNGQTRLVNLGLIKNTMKFIWERPEPLPWEDTLKEILLTAFPDYLWPADTISGIKLETPRKLIRTAITKRDGILVASNVFRCQFGGKVFGPEISAHWISEPLTKFQQIYIMHLLLAHGEDGHVGHGMVDWELFVDLTTNEARFDLRNQ
ncbi:hypothetical protein ST201phi2-1p352 [Pseudomonas phage 201phi2-1]|uniref:Uncharacterized protein n=1 Tax=Pseudomonas phage 201phi2-1 TaxID=198110 RepID=B3FJL3_BP201|nr:hypothetical protein ST201phi2-1p352 [Pseudomonas phage 201phi2-1]ABY63178.1 hypothetical protein 201phi2-1p352 [Pseudomonas phage 201phi2-1]